MCRPTDELARAADRLELGFGDDAGRQDQLFFDPWFRAQPAAELWVVRRHHPLGISMTLVDVYKRQWRFRQWSTIFDVLPNLSGSTVLDLGCAVGDQAAQLVARGARVIGFDMNDELLEAARGRQMPNAEFRRADLRALPDPGIDADGLWCSFAAAYFTNLTPVLVQWSRHLRPGAWIALTEVDDLFGHTPLSQRARRAFRGYAKEALAEGRYDFHMGHKLRRYAEEAGLVVTRCFTVSDAELSFDGPADSEVFLAWMNRLDGMKLLQEFCGADFLAMRDEFLAAISHPDHRSDARVFCLLASTPAPA